jgi:hypothetical protein
MSGLQSLDAVHYYRLRPTGQRAIFRQSEIRDVEATAMGAILTTKTGCEYKVDNPRPDLVIPEVTHG